MPHAELACMPVSEKTQLMESLWESLSGHEDAAIPNWHNDVLAERAAQLDQEETAVSPWSDAKDRIRS